MGIWERWEKGEHQSVTQKQVGSRWPQSCCSKKKPQKTPHTKTNNKKTNKNWGKKQRQTCWLTRKVIFKKSRKRGCDERSTFCMASFPWSLQTNYPAVRDGCLRQETSFHLSNGQSVSAILFLRSLNILQAIACVQFEECQGVSMFPSSHTSTRFSYANLKIN